MRTSWLLALALLLTASSLLGCRTRESQLSDEMRQNLDHEDWREQREKELAKEPAPEANPLQLQVQEISPGFDYVTLSGGSEDGVAVGQEFRLLGIRDDLPPSRYLPYQHLDQVIGQVEVVEVGPDTARARIIPERTRNPVKVGDIAMALLY
jgi:hypothetical protein